MNVNYYSLPREIVDLFIDEFDQLEDETSVTALRTCLMVCRAFCYRSRHHLFRKISLTTEKSPDVFPRLRSLLEIMKPTDGDVRGIARFIKSFEVVIDMDKMESGGMHYATLLRDSDGILVGVMNALRGPDYGVHKFTLGITPSPPFTASAASWDDLGLAFRQAFFYTIHSPYLTFLHIGSIYGMPSDCLRNAHLKHLHLSHTTFSKSPSETSSGLDYLPPRLECIQMNPAGCLGGIAGDYLQHLSGLNTLTSTVYTPEQLDITWDVMKAASSSLQDLQVDFFETFPEPRQAFDLGQITNLLAMAITHTARMPDEDVTYCNSLEIDVEHIHALLDTPTPASSLKRLEIMITSWQINPSDDFFLQGFEKMSKWHKLDTLLTSPKYPSLGNFDIFLSLPIIVEEIQSFDEAAFKTKIVEFFHKVLPEMHALKRVVFKLDISTMLFGWAETAAML